MIIFIDDKFPNIEGAHKANVGIHGIHFSSVQSLKNELKKHSSFWRIAGSFLLDMLPIVFGILIAVSINSWREKSHTKEFEKFYLSKNFYFLSSLPNYFNLYCLKYFNNKQLK